MDKVEAAATRVDLDRSAIGTGVNDLDEFRPGDALGRSDDAGPDTFPGNHAAEKDDAPLVPGEHVAAGDRPLDEEFDRRGA